VAKAQQVLGGRAGARLVVDDDRAVLRQVIRVDEDHRDAGAADLADLGMVGGQADGHDPVDRRAADREGQRAVQRRDEVQLVAEVLGGMGDALAEEAKNGLEKMTARACGVSTPRVMVWRWVSIRATGFGR
jgi:hypothetical protein